MQDDQIDAYFVCIRRKQLVERVAKRGFHTNYNIKTWKIDIDIVSSGL